MGFIELVLGIAILICFFVACSNLGAIRRYLRLIYRLKKVEMLESGKIDEKTNEFLAWELDEDDKAKRKGL